MTNSRVISILFLSTIFAAPCFGEEPTMLIYPTAAADTELDNSTPAKRITPPVREDGEYDPITPIGQIRGIVETLNTLETQQSALLDTVGKLQLGENKDLLPLIERGAKQGDAIGANVTAIAAKIDAIAQTTADLRASIESVQKTAASIERIRTSRWTDAAVLVILALVLIQIACKLISAIVGWARSRAERWSELAQAYELAKQQIAEQRAGAPKE